MRAAVLLAALVGSAAHAAPAPLPRPARPRDREALYLAAEKCREEAATLFDFASSSELSAEQKEAVKERAVRLSRAAAEDFARVARLLEDSPGEAEKVRADDVGLRAARAWHRARDYEKALAAYDRVHGRTSDPRTRVAAQVGAISCHSAAGRLPQVRARLKALRKDVSQLDREQRKTWESYLAKLDP